MVNKYPNYLIHHGVKGMKWGVRNDPERKQERIKYKQTKKALIAQRKALAKSYREGLKTNRSKKKQFEKATKEEYKQGKFSKERYKTYKQLNRENYHESNERLHESLLLGQYRVNKLMKANKAILIKNIKGENTKKYEKAVRSVTRSTEYYNGYGIRRNKDGSYRIFSTL